MAITQAFPGDKITSLIWNANTYYLMKGTPGYEDTITLANNVAGTLRLRPTNDPGSVTPLFQIMNAAGIQKFAINNDGSFTGGSAATFAGGLYVGGNGTIAGDLDVGGSTRLAGTLSVGAAASFAGTINVGGTATFNGSMNIHGILNTDDRANFSGIVTAFDGMVITGANGLTVGANTALGPGTLAVQNAATFNSTVDIVGQLTTVGALRLAANATASPAYVSLDYNTGLGLYAHSGGGPAWALQAHGSAQFFQDTELNTVGFNGTSAISKPTVTGSRGGNAALASLLTALANYGLITDSSS